MREVLHLWIGLVAFPFSISGCFISGEIEEGRKIDSDKVNKIVIGETTRSDIYSLFGTPHSQFQNQVELKEGSLRGFFWHVENRFLSTIDDSQYAILYRSVRTSGDIVIAPLYKGSQIRIKSNELLLLLDKKTNKVLDVAYPRK